MSEPGGRGVTRNHRSIFGDRSENYVGRRAVGRTTSAHTRRHDGAGEERAPLLGGGREAGAARSRAGSASSESGKVVIEVGEDCRCAIGCAIL